MNFDDIPQDELMATLRVPPHSIEAEAGVLSSLLLDNKSFDLCADLLEAKDFYRHEHKEIFGAITQMMMANKNVDVITVFESLRETGKAEQVGGLAYLNSVAQYVPSAANLRRYAEIVRDQAALRGLIAASDQIAGMAFKTSGKPIAEIINDCVQAVQALQTGKGQADPIPVEDCMESFIQNLEDMAKGRRAIGIATGYPTIDHMLNGGLKPGKLLCLAARPSTGKTALALQILRNVAQGQDGAAFLSQEMLNDELSNRLVASAGKADYGQIESGNPNDDTWGRIVEGVEAMRNLPLYINDQSSLTLADIQAKARRLRSKYGIKVLAIDYLQLCRTSSKHDNRATAIGEISRGLKALAMQLGITVIILSQLNRDVEKRTNGKPVMSDLKESGDIEQDCDTIMMLSEAEKSEEFSTIRCDIVKNRAGKKGEVALQFQGRYQRFEETVYDFSRFNKPSRKEL